jgi:signal peptidase I
MIQAFLVQGHSMIPQVQDRSLVLVRPVRGEPAPGEMVVYRNNQEGFPVVHRIHDKSAAGWRLQGDANYCPDPWPVAPADIIGRVCWVLPRLGRMLSFFHQEKW